MSDTRKALPGGVLASESPEADDPPVTRSVFDPSPDQPSAAPPSVFTWRLAAMVAAVMIVLVVMVAAVLQVGRSGYTVVKGEEGTVELLQGEGFLWFEPTVEVETDLVVAGLPDLDRERVEAGQEFETRSEADTYLAYLQTLVDDGS